LAEENFFETAYGLESAEETVKFYDRWAEVYDRDLGETEYQQPKRCAEALFEISNDSQTKILDVGCGTGLSGLALREKGYADLDGCDLSQGMLDKASHLEIYDRLFTCNLNEPPLDVGDASYDAATAVGVFSFGHIMPDAVDEILRVVKPGGHIIIGLNDHYYNEGSLTTKLTQLEADNHLEIIKQEHGDHIPGNDLMGWVLTLRKI